MALSVLTLNITKKVGVELFFTLFCCNLSYVKLVTSKEFISFLFTPIISFFFTFIPSSYGQTLATTTFIGETSFAVLICIVGLVLFSHLIGNMQVFFVNLLTSLMPLSFFDFEATNYSHDKWYKTPPILMHCQYQYQVRTKQECWCSIRQSKLCP